MVSLQCTQGFLESMLDREDMDGNTNHQCLKCYALLVLLHMHYQLIAKPHVLSYSRHLEKSSIAHTYLDNIIPIARHLTTGVLIKDDQTSAMHAFNNQSYMGDSEQSKPSLIPSIRYKMLVYRFKNTVAQIACQQR